MSPPSQQVVASFPDTLSLKSTGRDLSAYLALDNVDTALASSSMSFYAFFKRLMDIVAAACGLIVLLPVFVVVAAVVRMDSPGPVLYRQPRMGRGLVPFKAAKFRTMTVAEGIAANEGITCAAKQSRITKSGRILRKYRLDELPQLWNVLVGEMSLVGARPQTLRYIDIYPDIYRRVLAVRPGITGLATVRFHETEERMIAAAGSQADQLYIEKILPMKFKYDLFYVRHYGLWFDIKIIWWTIIGLIKK